MAKKTTKAVRLPTRKPGIERYSRIVLAAESLILEAGSLEGLMVAIIFQGSIYLFYGMVELPFIRRVYPGHD